MMFTHICLSASFTSKSIRIFEINIYVTLYHNLYHVHKAEIFHLICLISNFKGHISVQLQTFIHYLTKAIVHKAVSEWQMKFYGIWTRNFSFRLLTALLRTRILFYISAIFVPLIATFMYFMKEQKNNKKIKWKITFWISHSFASFAKKVIVRRNKKWKRGGKIKQRKSFLFFPFGNIFLFYIEEGMKIEGKHILGHYHHYQLNDFSHCTLFPLSCLVKCLDWCFNFIPFI